MKLNSAQVTEFKSVRDSGEFEIDDITCLVGKNEAGKTALLQALYRLNPVIPEDGKFDVTDDYPRSEVEDYLVSIETGKKPALVISAEFTLSEEEIASVEDAFGKGILTKNILRLSKGYQNKLKVSLWFNEKVAIDNIIENSQLPAELASEFSQVKSIQELWTLRKRN